MKNTPNPRTTDGTRPSPDKPLREGFTTGSAATAAALAALRLLITGKAPAAVDIPLPPFTQGKERARLTLPVEHCARLHAPEGERQATLAGEQAATQTAMRTAAPAEEDAAWPAATALVIKDGGDDPDATAHARIHVRLCAALHAVTPKKDAAHAEASHKKTNAAPATRVLLEGGKGVGRVTLPGLPVPVGQPAINPGPREQITLALQAECRAHDLCGELHVLISVEDGEELARHTMNARLGIIGGISILGTQGIVKPFSHSAWQASVLQGLHVARALDCRAVCLSTGRRSEKLLMALRPELPEPAFVQAADFAGFSLRAAGELGFTDIVWGCFFGKLVKLAQGLEYTHAHEAALDIPLLTRLAEDMGMRDAAALAHCITANHALELLLADAAGPAIIRHLGGMAQATAEEFAGRPVTLILFHLDGRTLLTL